MSVATPIIVLLIMKFYSVLIRFKLMGAYSMSLVRFVPLYKLKPSALEAFCSAAHWSWSLQSLLSSATHLRFVEVYTLCGKLRPNYALLLCSIPCLKCLHPRIVQCGIGIEAQLV